MKPSNLIKGPNRERKKEEIDNQHVSLQRVGVRRDMFIVLPTPRLMIDDKDSIQPRSALDS